MLRQVIVMGVTGSGKSTIGRRLAARCGYEFADADDFHPPANVAKMSAGIPLDDADREPWLANLAARLAEAEREGRSTVLACSALKRRYRDRLGAGLRSATFVHLLVPEAVLARRMRERSHFMPPELLASQLAELEPLGADESGIQVDGSASADAVADELAARFC